MSFNVEAFRNRFRPARATMFEVEFTLPPTLSRSMQDAEKLTFHASAANIPSMQIETMSRRRSTVTYQEWFPTNINFNDLTVSFLCDEDGQIIKLFRDWMDIIFPSSDSPGNGNFLVAYKSDYVAPVVTIRTFAASGEVSNEYLFRDVFPERLGDIPLNWGSENDMMSLQVEFKYRMYEQAKDILSKPLQGNEQTDVRNRLAVKPTVIE
jgi:hypothetical protein